MTAGVVRARPGAGIGLVEVLLALAILAAGFIPIYMLLRENRIEAADAGTFLSLVEKVQEQALAASIRPMPESIVREEFDAADGARILRLRVVRADPVGSFAPRVRTPQEGAH